MVSAKGSWAGYSAFQVFGDHVPMSGFHLVMRLFADADAAERVLISRASSVEPLDPEFGKFVVRAGMGLAETGLASMVLAGVDETIVLLRQDVAVKVGDSIWLHDLMLSRFSSRLALLTGRELVCFAEFYEFPDADVVAKSVVGAQEHWRAQAVARSARRLAVQLRGRGQSIDTRQLAEVDTQRALLTQHGVDVRRLPAWWFLGIAATIRDGEIELVDPIPSGDALAKILAGQPAARAHA